MLSAITTRLLCTFLLCGMHLSYAAHLSISESHNAGFLHFSEMQTLQKTFKDFMLDTEFEQITKEWRMSGVTYNKSIGVDAKNKATDVLDKQQLEKAAQHITNLNQDYQAKILAIIALRIEQQIQKTNNPIQLEKLNQYFDMYCKAIEAIHEKIDSALTKKLHNYYLQEMKG